MNTGADLVQAIARQVSSALGRQSGLITSLRPLYEGALAAVNFGHGIPWKINGVPFRIDPRRRQLMGEQWEPEVAQFLSQRVRPGDLCLDVGANAGIYVLQFCHWSEPDGRVFAFEPNPNTRTVLHKHVWMNRMEKRVDIVSDAVTDRVGRAELCFANTSGMSRIGNPNDMLADVAEAISVPTISLDVFCEQRKIAPDWLLMDIEGHELHALRGARGLFETCPNLQMIVEMHPSLWSSADTTTADWEVFFAETHLSPVALMGQADPLLDTGSVYLSRC